MAFINFQRRISLYNAFYALIRAPSRFVSTTSAINRGLRASRGSTALHKVRGNVSAQRRKHRENRFDGFPRNDTLKEKVSFDNAKARRREIRAKEFGRKDASQLNTDDERWSSRTGKQSFTRSSRIGEFKDRLRERDGGESSYKRHGEMARQQGRGRPNTRWQLRDDSREISRLEALSDRHSGFAKPRDRERPGRKQEDHPGRPHERFRKSKSVESMTDMGQNDKRTSPSDHKRTGVPVSIPYTTASSVFLYGHNTVLAALKAQCRKLYKLHTNSRFLNRNDRGIDEIKVLAKAAGIAVQNHEDPASDQILDKMSGRRPHNGVVLEASRLPAPPVKSLGRPDAETRKVPLQLYPQSQEDLATNGKPMSLPATRASWRHPFVVLLDGITDPENIGSIMRTAHFYGVDALAISINTCANLASAAMAKASSGACESVQLLALQKPSDFAKRCAENGWKLYAAVAPASEKTSNPRASKPPQRRYRTESLARSSPLTRDPCMLLLGAEGEGLRKILLNRAHSLVSITRGEGSEKMLEVGVDSVNVGVAAGILIESFMQRSSSPPTSHEEGGHGNLGF